MQSASARQRRATIPLSNKSFDAISLANGTTRSGAKGTAVGEAAACLLMLPTPPARRGSFLYRSSDSESDLSPISLSRKLSSTSDQQKSIEETLVTPFAQILQSLRTVRDNYLAIITSQPETRRPDLTCALADGSIAPTNTSSELIHESTVNNESSPSSTPVPVVAKDASNIPNAEVQLPLLNVEDADEVDISVENRSSRRPSRQTIADTGLFVDGTVQTFPEQNAENVSELAAQILSQLEPEVLDVQLAECLEVLHSWGPDIFHLAEITGNRPLTSVVYTLMKKNDALRLFKITPLTMVTYLTLLENNYRKENTYHNSIHAADVTQSANVLLGVAALQNMFSDLEILATLFSTAIHDVDHPGVTSQYLINSGTELALMYNDQSVLENHHLAVAFKLLQDENADIFQNLSTKSYKLLRRLVIDMVLATDMSKHMSLLADFKTLLETKRIAGSNVLKLEQYADKIQILKTLVHCADLSNPAKPLYLSRQWADRVMEEFFRQGDLEREQGLDVSPMCDRLEPSIVQTQVTFIDYVVHPLWEAWCELVYPDSQETLKILESNRDWYASQLTSIQVNPTITSDPVVEKNELDTLVEDGEQQT